MNPVQILKGQPRRCVLGDLIPDRYKTLPPDHFTRWEGLWCLVPDLEIVYKTAKPRGTKGNLISSTIINTVFAEVHQLKKTKQADDGEEASQPSSPTAASVSQSCIACAELIPQDWPRRFQYCRWGWPATEEAARTWRETKWACPVAPHRWNPVGGDDLKVYHLYWTKSTSKTISGNLAIKTVKVNDWLSRAVYIQCGRKFMYTFFELDNRLTNLWTRNTFVQLYVVRVTARFSTRLPGFLEVALSFCLITL